MGERQARVALKVLHPAERVAGMPAQDLALLSYKIQNDMAKIHDVAEVYSAYPVCASEIARQNPSF